MLNLTQTYTSKNTSHQKTVVPQLHRSIDFKAIEEDFELKHGKIPDTKGIVVDIGCGRYTAHIARYINSLGWAYISWDPYWPTGFSQGYILHCCAREKAHRPVVILCANVLNVINQKDVIMDTKELWYTYATSHMFFQGIYEGDKSNIGRVTKKDCYQRNETTDQYLYYSFEDCVRNIVTHRNNLKFIKKAPEKMPKF